MKRFLGLIGIVAIMFALGYISLTGYGKPGLLYYAYVAAFFCFMVVAVLWELLRKK
jgi:hypothetical protein